MKVAFITESFPERSETFILGKAVELIKRGHEVTVFSQFVRGPDVHPDLLVEIDLKKQVKRLPVWDRVRMKDLGRGLRASGVRPSKIAGLYKKVRNDPAFSQKRLLAFSKALPFLCDDFDVIHAHYGYMGFRYLEAPALVAAPLVMSLLGHDVTYAKDRYQEDYQSLYPAAQKFFASSEYLAEKAAELGFPKDKLSVLYPEVDTGFFDYADRSDRKNDKIALVSVCRLDWTKGLVYALEAVRKLVDQGRDVSYCIVGDGGGRSDVELAIKDLDLSDYVTLAGAQDREGCKEELYRADIFVLSSVTESFGLAVAEAQATGLPAVCAKVGGIPEIVEHERTGYLTPSRDSAALAEKIALLIDNQNARLEMGKQARETIVSRFHKDLIMSRLIDSYREAIQEYRTG